MRLTQRAAIAMASGSDLAEVSEYQPLARRGQKVRVYTPPDADGFAIALRDGQPIPPAIVEEFGPWRVRDTFGGWTVYYSGDVTP